MESSPTSTSTDTQTVPPSAPLELFLTNLKLYYDYFPFYKTNHITTLEQALNFRNFSSKLSLTEERKLRFLLINIRSLRESLPSSKSSQILHLMTTPLTFEDSTPLTSDTILKSFKSGSKTKYQQNTIKPSSLYTINLEAKKLTSISIETSFTNLTKLNLTDNFLQSITYMNCPNLEELILSNNFIKKMENLSQFPKLTKLDLSNNLIYIFENINTNVYLNEVNLSNQFIPKFVNFVIHPSCSNVNGNRIEYVNLQGCNIMNCVELTQFPFMRRLNISNNCIYDLMNVLDVCKRCPYIETLDVMKNPFVNENKTTYKNFIIIACANIREMDGKEVKDNEKIYVNNLFARKYGKQQGMALQKGKQQQQSKTDKNVVSKGMTVIPITKNVDMPYNYKQLINNDYYK